MRLAVVVPRYSPDIAGGAEKLGRGIALEAARRGWTVEVWTTRARSHYTWENVYPAGAERSEGIVVHRFPVALRDAESFYGLDYRLGLRGSLTLDEQLTWLESGPQSPALYEHIAAHAAEFDTVLVMPYAMSMMQCAAWAAPEHVIFWPCLHDEPYAYMQSLHLLMESVRGVAFNAPEEGALATRQLRIPLTRQAVIGVGVEQSALPSHSPEPVTDTLLYIGRLEGGKNLTLLYDYVERFANEGGQLRLDILGSGPQEPPSHPAFRYLGFVSEEEKAALCRTSLALCQPSLNESFSITIMESWLAGRPVLVHQDCAVTRGHVGRSKGGLWFRTYEEFAGAIRWLQENPSQANRMGQNGREYVRRNYTWEAVVDRLERLIQTWPVRRELGMPEKALP